MSEGEAIIVIGINRGGTSAVAASLHSAGIFLGDDTYSPIYEDPVLAKAFIAKDWKMFTSVVNDYSQRHKIFGWKLPDAIHDLKRVDKLFSKKKYIFVFRDLYAIAMRKEQALNQDTMKSMIDATMTYREVLKFIQQKDLNFMMVSYEKMLTEPQKYAENLIHFVGLEKNDQTIKKITDAISVSPEEYNIWSKNVAYQKKLNQYHLQGHLDLVNKTTVSGWAKSSDSDRPITVALLLDGEEVSKMKAEAYREDLINAGVSKTGKHGFKFNVADKIEPGAVISVIDTSSGIDLTGSPKTVH